jgi:hypothetical protein
LVEGEDAGQLEKACKATEEKLKKLNILNEGMYDKSKLTNVFDDLVVEEKQTTQLSRMVNGIDTGPLKNQKFIIRKSADIALMNSLMCDDQSLENNIRSQVALKAQVKTPGHITNVPDYLRSLL